jgi:hypothetical protein
MQSQVKIICCLALLLSVYCSEMTQADEINWNTFSSPKMQVLDVSSAQGEVISSGPRLFRVLGQYFWHWDPKKELKKTTDGADEILRVPVSPLSELMKNLFVDFDMSDTAHFRKVWFEPTPGVKFRGLFAIHDFTKKRPLIIIRMGIHGNLDELTAERFLVRIAYGDLDANFLVLESLTSPMFLSKNKNISVGGVDEGIFTFLALNQIDSSPLKSLISSYHLLAISLGAQGTFVTALLDQSNGHKIRSIANFCPLINLETTFRHLSEPGLKNSLADFWNASRLKIVLDIYPDEPSIRERWKTFFDWKPRFTVGVLNILNRDRHEPLVSVKQINQIIPKMHWPNGLEQHFKYSKDLYSLLDFWPYYEGVKTPMTIYTTPHDPLVVNELNSELIFSARQEGDFSNLKYHRLEHGVHCGIASIYKWDYIVKLVKEGLEL